MTLPSLHSFIIIIILLYSFYFITKIVFIFIYVLINGTFFMLQGHIGESPFDSGSWGKEHFQQTSWQLNPRGHIRSSVSLNKNLNNEILKNSFFLS